MTPKRPNWSKCLHPGVIQPWRPNVKLMSPGSPVSVGMRVTAQYGQNTVCLQITEALPSDDFKAEIQFFEPINVPKPKDLTEGEIVLIDREHICCLFPNDEKT